MMPRYWTIIGVCADFPAAAAADADAAAAAAADAGALPSGLTDCLPAARAAVSGPQRAGGLQNGGVESKSACRCQGRTDGADVRAALPPRTGAPLSPTPFRRPAGFVLQVSGCVEAGRVDAMLAGMSVDRVGVAGPVDQEAVTMLAKAQALVEAVCVATLEVA